jgi:hypothetical protein
MENRFDLSFHPPQMVTEHPLRLFVARNSELALDDLTVKGKALKLLAHRPPPLART